MKHLLKTKYGNFECLKYFVLLNVLAKELIYSSFTKIDVNINAVYLSIAKPRVKQTENKYPFQHHAKHGMQIMSH